MRAVQLDVAVGGEHQDSITANIAGEVLEEEQRRLVGPVDVVQEENDRLGRGHAADEPGHAVEQAQPLGFAFQQGRLWEIREALVHLGNQLRHLGRAAPQLTQQRRVGAAADVLPKRFDERQVRHGNLALVAVPREHLRAAEAGVDGELTGQAALADPGLAHEHDERAVAGQHPFQRLLELLHLVPPADEAAPDACLSASSSSVRHRLLRGRLGAGSDDAPELDRDSGRRLGAVRRGLGQQVQDEILQGTANFWVMP